MKMVASGLLSTGLVLAIGYGTARADDVFSLASPGNATVKTMEFQGDVSTQQVWWRRGYCGYRGYGYGYGGYGGYGGRYYSYSSYPYYGGYGYGGYGGYSTPYYGNSGYGYSPYSSGYGYGSGGYSPYSGGGYGYGSGYGYGGYSPYSSGYGYGYPSYGYSRGGYGYMGLTLSPMTTQPAPAASSTFPYNGGPQSPLPMPGGNPSVTPQPQQTIPAKTLMVSLPSTTSGGVFPIFSPVSGTAPSQPAAPAPARYAYPAYGEKR